MTKDRVQMLMKLELTWEANKKFDGKNLEILFPQLLNQLSPTSPPNAKKITLIKAILTKL